MYITRKLEKKVLELSASFPAVLVAGARQVGKTTLLRHLAEPGRAYVTLGIPENRMMAAEAPSAFLQKHAPPVIIDEFQYAPSLLQNIKAYVDARGECGDFWLSSSQNLTLMENITDSMVGRLGYANLHSLSRQEITGSLFGEYETEVEALIPRIKASEPMSRAETFSAIVKGGMPRLHAEQPLLHAEQPRLHAEQPRLHAEQPRLHAEQPRLHAEQPASLQDYFGSYFQTCISMGARGLAQVADELAFYKFMRVCGGLAAARVEYSSIAKKTGISVDKAKKWMSSLVSSGIVVLLPPYSTGAPKRAAKAPKLYFMDTGLLCSLRGVDDAGVLERLADSGVFFENYVVSEIYKSFAHAGRLPPLSYYRDAKNRKGTSLLIERNGALCPIDIRESASPGSKASWRFGANAPAAGAGMAVGTGNVICCSGVLCPLGDGVWAVPHWLA